MRIQILYGYRGHRTNEQFMPPGVQEVEDEFAAYLIANGHAVAVEAAPAPVAPRPIEPVTAEDAALIAERNFIEREVEVANAESVTTDFTAFTFTELKELAEAAGLEVVGTGKNGTILKADLVRALEGAEG